MPMYQGSQSKLDRISRARWKIEQPLRKGVSQTRFRLVRARATVRTAVHIVLMPMFNMTLCSSCLAGS